MLEKKLMEGLNKYYLLTTQKNLTNPIALLTNQEKMGLEQQA